MSKEANRIDSSIPGLFNINVVNTSAKRNRTSERVPLTRNLNPSPVQTRSFILRVMFSDFSRAMFRTRAWSTPQSVNILKNAGNTRLSVNNPYSKGVSIDATKIELAAFNNRAMEFPKKSTRLPLTDVVASSLIRVVISFHMVFLLCSRITGLTINLFSARAIINVDFLCSKVVTFSVVPDKIVLNG